MWDYSFDQTPWGFTPWGLPNPSPLGPEYLLNMSDELLPADSGAHGQGGGSGGGSGGSGPASGPASTLVGSSTGLEIDLIWDSSVRTSSSWQAIESAVVSAAEIYTKTFSNHVVLNIDVGFGEIDGKALAKNDLGESESNGYITGYKTVESALNSSDAALVKGGEMTSNATAALQGLSGESFFVTSAEAKALGLVGASSEVDGYIGLNSSSLLSFGAPGHAVPSGQYDAVGVAAHEISEVMGRIGNEGESLGSYKHVYDPLDIFRYSSAHDPDTAPTSGYFSLNDGVSDLGTYNNPSNGGDAADWASLRTDTQDSYDAFDNPGVVTLVTSDDLLEVASLGYQVDAGTTPTTQTA